MFIPSEAMAAAAFSMDADLMDYAMSKSVSSPHRDDAWLAENRGTVLQQHALPANEIYEVSRELYKRMNKTMEHSPRSVGTSQSSHCLQRYHVILRTNGLHKP